MKKLLLTIVFLACAATVQAQGIKVGTCTFSANTGSPEGVRYGSPCDTYWRTDSPYGVYLKTSGTATNTGWVLQGGGGTVTSVALTTPGIFSVSGSPITVSGTLAVSLVSQSANLGLFSPNGSSGSPTFRKVVFGDWGSSSCLAGAIPKFDGTDWQCGVDVGAAVGAPANEEYIVGTATANLSAEQSLGALTTGLLRNTVSGSTGTLSTATAGTHYVAPGAVTTSGLTMTSARVLGRTTASTGAIEEFTALPMALGGTDVSSASDDQVLVSSGSAWQAKTVPNCTDTSGNHLNYTQSSNTWSCGTSGGAATGFTDSIGLTIDGGGSAISTGVKGFALVPWSGTIIEATVLSTDASVTSGSIVIEVWKDSYANYPPTGADKICASACPTLSSATKSQDSTLTGWSTSITSGDIVGYSVTSASTVTRVTLVLKIQR